MPKKKEKIAKLRNQVHKFPLILENFFKLSNHKGAFVVATNEFVAIVGMHQGFHGGTLTIPFLGHQLEPPQHWHPKQVQLQTIFIPKDRKKWST